MLYCSLPGCSAGSILHSAAALDAQVMPLICAHAQLGLSSSNPSLPVLYFLWLLCGLPLLGVKYQSHSWLCLPRLEGIGKDDWR